MGYAWVRCVRPRLSVLDGGVRKQLSSRVRRRRRRRGGGGVDEWESGVPGWGMRARTRCQCQ
jgi:hypothetical protein